MGGGSCRAVNIGTRNNNSPTAQPIDSSRVWGSAQDNGLQYQMLCDPGGTGSSAGLLWPPEDNSEL